MVNMFKWFCKNKNELNETKKMQKSEEVQKPEFDNYKIDNDGNIIIRALYGLCLNYKFLIPKESIVSHQKESIVFKDYIDTYNHQINWGYNNHCIDYCQTMENKENFIKYKETRIKYFSYSSYGKQWNLTKEDTVGTEVILERTPLDVFEKEFNSKYKLIETIEEFNDYLSSTLDCDTWCRKKLYDKMKELGLGDGFINQFADLVGNNLDKYYAMIDLANEVSDKDTLMYLYTYKFRK